MTTRRTLSANKGETFQLSVRYLDENRAPINVSAYSASFTLKDKAKDLPPQYYGGIETTADGWVNITVPADVTLTWPSSSSYVVAIELGGVSTWLVSGTLNAGDH